MLPARSVTHVLNERRRSCNRSMNRPLRRYALNERRGTCIVRASRSCVMCAGRSCVMHANRCRIVHGCRALHAGRSCVVRANRCRIMLANRCRVVHGCRRRVVSAHRCCIVNRRRIMRGCRISYRSCGPCGRSFPWRSCPCRRGGRARCRLIGVRRNGHDAQ